MIAMENCLARSCDRGTTQILQQRICVQAIGFGTGNGVMAFVSPEIEGLRGGMGQNPDAGGGSP